jgi:hypothetical protein
MCTYKFKFVPYVPYIRKLRTKLIHLIGPRVRCLATVGAKGPSSSPPSATTRPGSTLEKTRILNTGTLGELQGCQMAYFLTKIPKKAKNIFFKN